MKGIENFEYTSIPKVVFKNALPAIISMLVVLLYNMADTFFVGQTGDEIQVAAVSLATPVFLIFMATGSLFGIGGTSSISRALGNKNNGYAANVSSFCFWMSIFVGIGYFIIFQLFMNPILNIIGTSVDTIEPTRNYLSIVSWSAPFVLVSTAFSNIVRAEGKSNEAMVGTTTGTILNIILDPLLILTFKMGISGAAWATVIGNIVATAYYLIIILRGDTFLSLKLRNCKISRTIIYEVFSIGIPASLQSIMMSVSSVMANILLAKYGDTILAAYGISIKLAMIAGLLQMGLGQGIQPVLGYCYGAQQTDRFRAVIKYSNKLAISMGLVLTAVCWLFAEPMTHLFIDSRSVTTHAVPFLKTLLLSGPALGILFVHINALQAMGAAKESLLLSICRQGLIFIPLLYGLNELFGLNGLVPAQPIADAISCVLAAYLFRRLLNQQ